MSTPNQPNPAQQASDAVIDKILSREFSLGDPISRYIRGDTMATGFAKADVIRAVLEAARELTAAQGVQWPNGVLNRAKTLDILRSHNEWRRGAEGPQIDPLMLGLALEAAIAALSQPIEPQGAVVDRPGDDWHLRGYTYASKQATKCAQCGEYKHTPLRVDEMDGYVCLTCIDKKMEELFEAALTVAVGAGEDGNGNR